MTQIPPSLLRDKQHHYEFKLAGSLAEGVFTPRFFGAEKKKFEIDVEFIVLQIGSKHIDCVSEVPGKRGFAQISMRGKCAELTKENRRKPFRSVRFEKKEIHLSEDGFLLTQELKRHMLYNKVFLSSGLKKYRKMMTGLKLCFSYVLHEPFSALEITNMYRRITKSTCEAGLDLRYQNKIVSLSADASITIKLEWKPRVLTQWENRNRKWPSNVKEIIGDGEGFLIAKTSAAERNNNKTTEFRYSFAHVERKLITMHSHTQRLVYMLFKSIIYKWILPIDPGDHLTSYVGKTIMLWTCEQNPPSDHTFWIKTRAGLKRSVIHLLSELARNCRERFMRYFFIPEINVLENIETVILDAVVEKIDDIIEQFDEHVRELVQGVYELEDVLLKARNAAILTKHHLRNFLSDTSFNSYILKWQLDMLSNFGVDKVKDVSNFRKIFGAVTDNSQWDRNDEKLFDLYFYRLSETNSNSPS